MMGREGGMPRERSDMRRIREVLRLRDEFGASVRRIAAACRMPRTTVRDYLRRLESAELRFGDGREWSDAELERRLFPPPTAPSRPLPEAHPGFQGADGRAERCD